MQPQGSLVGGRMTPNKDRQAAFRARQLEKLVRRGRALQAILVELEGKDKPLSIKLRQIAEEGLR